MTTYRDIFKWGDKREVPLDNEIKKIIKEKFNFTDEDLTNNSLEGKEKIILKRECQIPEKIVQQFIEVSGRENVIEDSNVRASHSYGKHFIELLKLRLNQIDNPPDLVIYPRTEDEIIEIVKICNINNIPIIPFGGGSSVTCALQAPNGGISLDLSKYINEVIEVNEINHSVTVQAGILGPDLELTLNNHGLGYTCGHFPQSFEYSSVGGWIAARGAGTMSTGYGKIEEMLLSLKVVTPSGIIETEDYPADAQAIDFNHVFLGSEGIFGVITQACLKIRKFQAKNTAYASFVFKSFESAIDCMRKVMQLGIGKPHLFRVSDPEETQMAFKLKGFEGSLSDKFLTTLGYKSPQRVLMFTATEGNAKYSKLVKRQLKKIAKKNSGFYIGILPTKKWLEQRYSSAYSRDPIMDKAIITDTIETAVTWDNLIDLWNGVRKYLKTRLLTVSMSHISHVYENGANLYITFLSPWKKGEEVEDYIKLHKGLVDTIIDNKGSLSHHHGIGRILSKWMDIKFDKTQMALLEAIKNNLDPNNIMNPGNMLGLK